MEDSPFSNRQDPRAPIDNTFDLKSILAAAQSLSACVELSELLKTFAPMTLQASGAERLVLLLPNEDDVWEVRVSATAESTTLASQPLQDNLSLPVQLIQHVERTKKIFPENESALEQPFVDSYLQENACCSLLCAPLLHQDKLNGLLYLEHSSVSDVFNHKRITVIDFLCAQTAIALNNAVLRKDIAEREELQQQQNQLAKTLKATSRRLHNVLKWSLIGIWEWSFADQRLTWDAQMFEIYGVDPADFGGTYEDWEQRLHPDDFSRITADEHRAASTANAIPNEFRIVRPDGAVRHIYANVFFEKNELGETTRTVGINFDITDRRKAELALLASENKFQRIAEGVPGMVYRYVIQPDGTDRMDYVSSGVRELFEVDPQESVDGKTSIWDRVHKSDQAWMRKAIELSAETLEPFLLEYRLELPEKGLRWVQACSQPIRGENGEVIWDGIVLDHTEQKTTQLALDDARRHITTMNDNVPGMIFRYIVNEDGSRTLPYVSPKSEGLFGVAANEIQKHPNAILASIHPEDRQRVQKEIRRSRKELQPYKQEFRVILDGRVEWRQVFAQPNRNEDGDTSWDGVALDITERKEAQLALHEKQSQFQRMTKNVPGMIFRYVRRTDGSHAMTYVSSQSRELYEIEPEEMLEDVNKLFDCFHPDDMDSLRDAVDASARNLTPFDEEFRVILPNQGLRWRQAISKPTRAANGDIFWDGVTIDITHSKRAELQLQLVNEELARATKMKDEFLANMSHELRTPLNAILGMTEGLQGGIFGSVTDKQRDSYEVIQQSGAHLLELINEVLDLAKIESGSMDLEFSSVNIAKLCESGLQLVQQQAEKKDILLNLNVPHDLPAFAADEKRLRQVLVNLLSNAVKFTPNGGLVKLEVVQLNHEQSREKIVRISVSDNGIGIEPMHLDTLFDPFVQVDSSLNRSYSGTGLGLSLVKRFVELHSGSVSVTSEPDVGSCFTVDLPIRQRTARSATTLPQRIDPPGELKSPSSSEPTREVSILLAEDNELVARTVIKFLQASNFRVELATNGAAAIEMARDQSPDLILMDVQMPGVDGLEAIQRIRQIAKHEHTPIIALTGLAMQSDADRCLAAGADHYLSKPYGMQQLVDLMRKELAKPSTSRL